MINGKWVSPVTVTRSSSASPRRWGTFYAGQTYTGVAYTQNSPQESWATFKANMASKVGKPGVDQGSDCSGFASFAWQIPRQTTWTFLPKGYAYKLSSLSSLLPGDAFLREYDHIGLYEDRLDNGNFMVLEQTPPKAVRGEWSYSYASTYMPVRRNDIATAITTPLGSFKVDYFKNKTLTGTPAFSRTVAYPFSQDWGAGSPGSGLPSDGFSARATGTHYFDVAGTYSFNVTSDDGVRVWLDGKLIVDRWTNHPTTTYRVERPVTVGKHTIKIEYYENVGNALVGVRWWRTRTCPNGQFLAEYFSNTYLGGAPAARACETSLTHTWGTGSPDDSVPSDNFSGQWVGKFSFQARSYTFIAKADDGVRVWVDGTLIIDQWKTQSPTEYRVTRKMTAGTHTVVVQHFAGTGSAQANLRWQ
jgi:hypothetical protein